MVNDNGKLFDNQFQLSLDIEVIDTGILFKP